MSATQNLLEGYTHWKAFQNRILAPFCVTVISKIFYMNDPNSFEKSLKLFLIIMISLINIILQTNVYNRNFAEKIITFISVNFGFFLFSCGIWYPWDFVEFVFFYFLFMIISKNNIFIYKYWILCILWTFNKETAIFVPISFFISKFRFDAKNILSKENIKIFLNSSTMSIFILSYTYIVRNFMFKHSTLNGIGVDFHNGTLANFINVRRNFIDMFLSPTKQSTISILLYIIYAFFSIKLYGYRKIIGKKFLSLWFIVGLYLVIVFISALVVETRIFFPLSAMAIGLYFSQNIIKVFINKNNLINTNKR